MGKGASGAGRLAVVGLLALAAAVWWIVREAGEDGRARRSTDEPRSTADASELPSPEAATAAALPAVPEALAPAELADSAAGVAPDEEGQPLRITGRVLDPDGRPVPGATVLVVPSRARLEQLGLKTGRFDPPLDPALLASTSTGADGRFTLDARDVPPDASAMVERGHRTLAEEARWPAIVVIHPAFEAAARTCRGWSGGPYEAPDIGLRLGASVTGRVEDEAGQPLHGVRISPPPLYDRYDRPAEWESVRFVLSAISGADGGFRLDSLWAGKMDLQFEAADRLRPKLGLELAAGEVRDLGVIVLGRGAGVEGRVLDARSGQPLAGARVLVRPTPLRGLFEGSDTVLYAFKSKVGSSGLLTDRETRTDEAGTFRIEGIDPTGQGMGSATLDVLAGAPGYEPARLTAIVADGPELNLALEQAASIEVHVVDPDSGEPIRDATLTARRYTNDRDWEYSSLEVVGDAQALLAAGVPAPHEGVFLLAPAGSHRNTAVVSAPGRATRGFRLPTVVAPERASFTAQLPREVGFSGRVMDEDGRAIPGAKVTLAAPTDLRVKLPDRDEKTDEQGLFRFAGLLHGDWDATASARGFVASPTRLIQLRLATAGVDEEFVLQRGGAIAGTVLSAGQPQAGAWLLAKSLAPVDALPAAAGAGGDAAATGDEADSTWRVTANEEGRFLIEGLAAGEYEITGPPGVQQVVRVEAGETAEVTVQPRRLPRLHGRVTDARGPVVGATIGVELLMGDLAGYHEGGGSGTSGPDGSFDFESSAVGPVRVAARHERESTPALELELAWDGEHWLDLRFGGGELRGLVLSATRGTPLVGARVQLRRKFAFEDDEEPDYHETQRQTSDAQGRFAFGRLLAGEYGVSVSAPGHARASVIDLQVREGEVGEDVRVSLVDAGEVQGVVVAPDGKALGAQLVVRLDCLGGSVDRQYASVDAAGRFQRDGLVPGRWRCELRDLELPREAPPLASAEVLIVVGQVVEVELALPP